MNDTNTTVTVPSMENGGREGQPLERGGRLQ